MTAYWHLIRPVNCIIAELGVGLGFSCARFSALDFPARDLSLLMLSAFFIAAFGNVLNDLFDHDIDLVNRPWRPIPSKAVSPKAAFRFANLLCLLGLACARAVSLRFFLMAGGVTLLLWLYDGWLKRTVIVGNLAVALLTGFTLLYGGFLGDAWMLAFWPALFAFLLNLAREIVKDMADIEGDRAVGCATLPIRFGTARAANLVSLVLLALVFLIPRAYLTGAYDFLFFAISFFGVIIPSFVLVLLIQRHRDTPRKLDRMAFALKAMMFAGIAAVLAGKRSPL